MKMTIRLCANTVEEIKMALIKLAEERFESNACGVIQGVDFDYDFVNSDDLYSDDSCKPTIQPI